MKLLQSKTGTSGDGAISTSSELQQLNISSPRRLLLAGSRALFSEAQSEKAYDSSSVILLGNHTERSDEQKENAL